MATKKKAKKKTTKKKSAPIVDEAAKAPAEVIAPTPAPRPQPVSNTVAGIAAAQKGNDAPAAVDAEHCQFCSCLFPTVLKTHPVFAEVVICDDCNLKALKKFSNALNGFETPAQARAGFVELLKR